MEDWREQNHRQHGDIRKLKPRIPKRIGIIEQNQHKRGGERAHRVQPPPQRKREKTHQQHDHAAHHGRGKRGDCRIERAKHRHREKANPRVFTKQQRKRDRKQGHMQPRNGQQMRDTGITKSVHHLVVNVRDIAENHTLCLARRIGKEHRDAIPKGLSQTE
ncbi:hypothetical protein SDC9_198786 [bioreactor metagenome]|uniref:Uncharacterized protein n=1 Tax=bioreactor metagenome TaxID=1076179 RepID=A0A645IRW6_9ZZZZ